METILVALGPKGIFGGKDAKWRWEEGDGFVFDRPMTDLSIFLSVQVPAEASEGLCEGLPVILVDRSDTSCPSLDLTLSR